MYGQGRYFNDKITSCDGIVIKNAGPFHNKEKCISEFAYEMCYSPNTNFIIILFTLMGINTIFYITACMCRKMRAPLCSFIVSLVQNLIFSVFILDITCLANLGPESLYFGTLFPCLFVIIPMNLFTYVIGNPCNPVSKETEVTKYRKLMFPNKRELDDSVDDIDSYIHKGCANPPLIKIKGVCTMRMQFGTKTRLMYERYADYLPYGSWENHTEVPEIKDGALAVIRLNTDYSLSPALETNLSIRKQHLKDEAEKAGFSLLNDKVCYKVYNCKKTKVVSNGNCFFGFLNSCFGKFLFILSHLFGFQSIIENIFGMTVTYYDVDVKRNITDTNDMTNAYLNPDEKIPGGEICQNPPLSVVPHASMNMGQQMLNNMYQNSLPQQVAVNQVGMGNQQIMPNGVPINQVMVQPQQNQMMMQPPQNQVMVQPQQNQMMMQPQPNQMMMQPQPNQMMQPQPNQMMQPQPNQMIAQNDPALSQQQMLQLQQQNELLQQQIQLQQQQLQQMQQIQQLQQQIDQAKNNNAEEKKDDNHDTVNNGNDQENPYSNK